MAIKKNNIVEKRNVLNEVRRNNMTLQELRFFSIYLSKINARDVNTRKVRFPLTDFQKIMEFKRLNINRLKATTNSLLSKVVNIPTERGGYTAFQLFKKCTVDQDEYEEWFIEIDAHDDALPLMFDFKKDYFTYELWNALRLKSNNQLRMYELLKQYEKIGKRKLQVIELRDMLGIGQKEYPRWDNFKQWVIDACQQALEENTDIKFTYEPIKKGRGGKITSIMFTITKNENHVDPLSLAEFISQQDMVDSKNELPMVESESTSIEITDKDNTTIKPITLSQKSYNGDENTRLHEYLNGMGKNYDEAQQLINEAYAIMLDKQRSDKTIRNTYEYTKGIINNKLEQEKQRAVDAQYKYKKPGKEPRNYDDDPFEDLIINSSERINANDDLHKELYQG